MSESRKMKLRRLLRQNAPRKDGTPGSFMIRLFVQEDPLVKPKRIEVGLGTNDEDEAVKRAESIVRAFYAAGGRFTHKTGFRTHEKGSAVSVAQAAAAINRADELPLWRWKVYPLGDDFC